MARDADGGNWTATVLAAVLMLSTQSWGQPRAQEREQFVVREAWFTAAGPGRFLHADMHVPASQPLRQTLKSGLRIDFSLQVAVQRGRWWWLDERAAEISWRATLSYDPILRQYKLATADGFRRSYSSLRDALDRMGVLRRWPVTPEIAPVLNDPDSYLLARLEVDVSRLPQPVKILLLTDDEWDFDSGWIRLPLLLKSGAPPPGSPAEFDAASESEFPRQ